MHSQSSQLDSAPAGASHNGCATSLLRDLDVFLQPCCVGSDLGLQSITQRPSDIIS